MRSPPSLDGLHRSVVVIGGGQAGLAMSYCLTYRGIDHVVLEKERIGHEWATRRWDTFCLVTPNWQCQLPGFGYRGDDPDGFMVRDQIVAYLRAYAASFQPPLHEGLPPPDSSRTPAAVSPCRPTGARSPPTRWCWPPVRTRCRCGPGWPTGCPTAWSSCTRRNTARRTSCHPAGYWWSAPGQSGCQIAEDLHLARRPVHLAVGSAPRVARVYRGRDVVAWLDDMGYYRKGIDQFADADAVRFRANHYVTGRDGGHDIDLRQFALEGMRLYGRLTDIRGGMLHLLGLPWQYTWGSGRFCGVSEDARYLTDQIVSQRMNGSGHDVRWLAGTPADTYPSDDDWVAPRTVA